MRLTQQIIELCLIGDQGLRPFAVLVEQGDRCGWATAPGICTDAHWLSHVLRQKQRRGTDAWVLSAWSDWLSDIAQEAPDRRRAALERLEASTPGVVVKRPRAAHTALPAHTLAKTWVRRRLHYRAEVIASNVAARLAGRHGSVHWDAELRVESYDSFYGDWIIERQPQPGRVVTTYTGAATGGSDLAGRAPPPDITLSSAFGLAVIHVIDADDVADLQKTWSRAREALGVNYPFGIAIVRGSSETTLLDTGCITGERSKAPESLAVAAVRAQWARALG